MLLLLFIWCVLMWAIVLLHNVANGVAVAYRGYTLNYCCCGIRYMFIYVHLLLLILRWPIVCVVEKASCWCCWYGHVSGSRTLWVEQVVPLAELASYSWRMLVCPYRSLTGDEDPAYLVYVFALILAWICQGVRLENWNPYDLASSTVVESTWLGPYIKLMYGMLRFLAGPVWQTPLFQILC